MHTHCWWPRLGPPYRMAALAAPPSAPSAGPEHVRPLSEDVVAMIAYVSRCQAMPAASLSPAETQEILRDLHTMMRIHLSSVLTAPLTGRMFVAMPVCDDAPELSRASRHRQLL